jgi:dolichol-phosphate mannosyltransferase
MLSGHDVVIGSRYTRGGGLGEWNPIRKLISAAAVWVTWPLQRSWMRAKDPMSGFFLVRRRCVEKVMFQPTGFKLLLEILVRGNIRSVHEVPFAFGKRCAGCSKASLKVAWEYFVLLLKLYGARWSRVRVTEEAVGD